jgi:hypothetical protein
MASRMHWMLTPPYNGKQENGKQDAYPTSSNEPKLGSESIKCREKGYFD